METEKIISSIADGLGDFIKKRIESSLTPLHVLSYVVDKLGKPVIDYENMFDPSKAWEENKQSDDDIYLCYGIYSNNDDDHKSLGLTGLAEVGKLTTLEINSRTKQLAGSPADDYVDYYTPYGSKEVYGLKFVNHYLNIIEKGMTYESIKDRLTKEIARSIATSIPYEEIIKAYSKEEVGRYHNLYESQCYIDDCREAADNAE